MTGKKKRWRTPTAKPGELKIQWGKLPNDVPDIIYTNGEGVNQADRQMLHHRLSSPRLNYEGEMTTSFFDELVRRGYDLTTLKFSIRKHD